MKKIHTLSPRKDVEELTKELHDLLKGRIDDNTAITLCIVKDGTGSAVTDLPLNKSYDASVFHDVQQGGLPTVRYTVERLAVHVLVRSGQKVYDLSKMWMKFEARPYLLLEDRRAIDKATARGEGVKVSDVLIPAYYTNMVIPEADTRTVLYNVFLAHVWNQLVTLANPHISGTYPNTPARETFIKTTNLNRVATTGLSRTPHVLRSMNMRKLLDVLGEVTKELQEAGAYTTSLTVNEQYGFRKA